MVGRLVGALLALTLLIPACRRGSQIVEGGVYAFAGSGGDFTISKVLREDEFAVHLRTYKESFKTVPTSINTGQLTVMIGHAPLAREGFLKEQPKLISVEKVADSELEGYRYYLETMGTGR
jgi:hypothetical protein